ncbi:MurR/RpiR family transcriptional regulator, partial [Enterococcus faecium]
SIQSIKKAQLQIEHEDLDQIGKVLNKAQRIFLFAKGVSQITARKFQNKMVKLNKFLIMAQVYSDSSRNAATLISQ